MADIHYQVVEHDGGWAYRLDGVYSETFRTREQAHAAAAAVAAEQAVPGDSTVIAYQDSAGEWHEETAKGEDRPSADVNDEA
jgi:hypothetical protein